MVLWLVKYNNGSSTAYPQSVSAAGTGRWELLQMTLDLPAYANITEVDVYARNGDNTTKSQCYWDDLRFFPSDAYVTTTAYDPTTLAVMSTTDANNVTSYMSYDGFVRAAQSTNDDRKVISQSATYLSREKNSGTFNPADPNFSTSIVYTSTTGYNDFSSSTGWTYRGHTTFNVSYQGETCVQVGLIPGNCIQNGPSLVEGGGGTLCPDTAGYITKPAGSGDVIARVDFYPYQNGNLLQVLAFHTDGSPINDFCVQYYPLYALFQVRADINGASWILPYDFSLYAPINHWYTIEIEKTSGGRCYAWVYPKGSSRNYADMYTTSGYPSNWNCNVWSWSLDDYMYLANNYVGSYSQSTTFRDGLGRLIQSQVRDGVNDLVSAVQYDSLGRAYRAWRTYSQNTTHLYDTSFQTNARSYYNAFSPGIQNPYTETEFYPDPLSRIRYNKPSGQTTSNEFVETRYGTASYSGATYNIVDAINQPRIDLSTKVISRRYMDKLGRIIKTAVLDSTAPGAPVEIQSSLTTSSMLGEPTQVTDPKGLNYTTAYDFLGRAVTKISPDQGRSQFIYDNAGRLRFMVDSVGAAATPDNVLYWKYDSLGRVIEKGYLSANWSTFTQTLANDRTYPTTPVTWRKKYIYDGDGTQQYMRGRLYQVITNNNDDSTAEVTESFLYDKYGNVISSTLLEVSFGPTIYTTSYEYDHLNRLTKVYYPATTQANVLVSNQTYTSPNSYLVEATGSITTDSTVAYTVNVNSGASVTFSAGSLVDLRAGFWAKAGCTFDAQIKTFSQSQATYAYNQQGRISSVGNGSDPAYYATYTYNADGSINQEVVDNNNASYKKTIQYGYNDPRGRLRWVSSSLFSDTLTYTTGSFDASGYYDNKIASSKFTYAAGSGMTNYAVKYRYDDPGRITVADVDASSYNAFDLGINGSGTADPMTYDGNGNLLAIDRHGTVSGYTYTTGTNKLRYTSGSTDQYTYDPNANITQSTPKGLTSVSYDLFTQLTMGAATATTTTSFEYDGRKERVLKKVVQGSTTTSTLYLRGLSEYPLTEKASTGGSRQYVYGPTGLLCAIDSGGATYYTFKDHLGSVRAVMNGATGAGVEYTAYDSYGKVMQQVISPDIKYRFTGQEWDGQTGVNNFRARMFDQDIGRFYASDPAGQDISPFGYAGGNPITFTDPTGRVSIGYVSWEERQQQFEAYRHEMAMQSYYETMSGVDCNMSYPLRQTSA
ncbi:MAG: RHS repeat-associated core domain-containing protein [Ignavibacteriae bacterium]|nr:RHS repeat-associated core domain-containing protein [Ignavibacteriota bacterium]